MMTSFAVELVRSARDAIAEWQPARADERWSVRRCIVVVGAGCAGFWAAAYAIIAAMI